MTTPQLPSWLAGELTDQPGPAGVVAAQFAQEVTAEQGRRAATVVAVALRRAGVVDVDVATNVLLDGAVAVIPLSGQVPAVAWQELVDLFGPLYRGEEDSSLLDGADAGGEVVALFRAL